MLYVGAFFVYHTNKHMGRRFMLLVLALSFSLAHASAAPEPSVVQVYKDLSVPNWGLEAKAVRRAHAFPSLALMPRDAEAYLVVNDLGKMLQRHSQGVEGWFPGNDEEIGLLQGFAVVVDRGNAEALSSLLPLYAYFTGQERCQELAGIWSQAATPEAAPMILAQADDLHKRAAYAALKTLPQAHLKPVYAVLSIDHRGRALLQSLMEQQIARLRLSYEAAESNGFRGVCIPLSRHLPFFPGDDGIVRKVNKEIASRKFYLLFKMEGASLVAVFCEDPKDIRLERDPEKSLASADSLKECDHVLPGSVRVAGYVCPGLLNWAQEAGVCSAVTTAGYVKQVFDSLCSKGGKNDTAYVNASRGIGVLVRYLKTQYARKSTLPVSFHAWHQEDGWNVQLAHDAHGAKYEKGPLMHCRLTRAAGSILYVESSPLAEETDEMGLSDLISPGVHVLQGVAATMDPALPGMEQAELGRNAACIRGMLVALANMREALGKGFTFVVDAGGEIPPVFGAKAGNKVAIPRFAYYNVIEDRKMLAEGWKAFCRSLERLANKPGWTKQLIEEKPGKGYASYSVSLPFATPHMAPNATVGPLSLAVGSSSVLNGKLQKFDNGTVLFSGRVLTFRPQRLVAVLKGIAGFSEPQGGGMLNRAAAVLEAAFQGIDAVHATTVIRDGRKHTRILLYEPKKSSEDRY